MQQFGLRIEKIEGTVTGACTDIDIALGKVFKWEGCLPHLLHRVTMDATGMSMGKKKSKNPFCRELLESVKAVVEHFNESDVSKVRHNR